MSTSLSENQTPSWIQFLVLSSDGGEMYSDNRCSRSWQAVVACAVLASPLYLLTFRPKTGQQHTCLSFRNNRCNLSILSLLRLLLFRLGLTWLKPVEQIWLGSSCNRYKLRLVCSHRRCTASDKECKYRSQKKKLSLMHLTW